MKLTDHVTDWDNQTFDTGRSLAVFVVLAGVALVTYDVVVHDAAFDMQAYGVGIAGILTGLAAYLFGDGKSRPASMTTTTTTMGSTPQPLNPLVPPVPVNIVGQPVKTKEVPHASPKKARSKAKAKTRRR